MGARVAFVDSEISSQPDCWRRAVEVAARSEIALPHRGHRVAAAGCGTSWFVAQAYAVLRESAGHGETDAYPASEFPTTRRYDRVLLVSRSGTTTEILDVMRRLPAGTPVTMLTADPQSPAAARASDPIPLPFAEERSVVQTRFPTTVLAVLRAHLGEDLRPLVADGLAALDAELPLGKSTEQVTFLGQGWTVGLAREAALKCREAAGMWAEAYPAMEYRHGPIAVAGPNRAVWAMGELPPGLAEEITRTGASLVPGSGRDPLAELVLVQRYAVALARQRGLDPDAPPHLTRSVVLR
jgi:fructoselysine-6-P-deglycase FrlB-like protein